MTIEQFNNRSFKSTDKVIYKGKQFDIVSVDFDEKLIAICEVNDEDFNWKRCVEMA